MKNTNAPRVDNAHELPTMQSVGSGSSGSASFPMSNTIKITVESTAGAGKSSVAFAIAAALREHGIECTIGGIEDALPGVMERTWRDRIKSVAKGKRTVEITTKQLRRDSIG